ncbi:adhesion G protein-coupled receptor G3-like isoform X2 [Paralichthys olivaceus]|uniref:adhesion G protein-coupled receptor G3-like isoform X2 n=1 Tax=Paralichthys olivaceus TaxID=8255 RepID=UPI00097D8E59|nr:PREDICTED: adhesion G protein-coupled receptor G3-like [Paralichthys olivaceus]
MTWIFLVTLSWLSTAQAANWCKDVLRECYQNDQSTPWTRCYERRISTCFQGRHFMQDFILQLVNSSIEAEVSPTTKHRVHIPSSALQRSRGNESEMEVVLVATVLNSTYFTVGPHRTKATRGAFIPNQREHMQGTVMGGLVLAVKAGRQSVRNLPQPVKLTFTQSKQMENRTCVFWQELDDGTGNWITDGCYTSDIGAEVICSCNHLSFFAVLVNPVLSVDETHSTTLSYITYIGSALSVVFTVMSLIIYICLQRRRPEKVISVHMHLAGALLCLHLSFLLSCFWVWLLDEKEEGWVCFSLGLFLHWSLLATFCWMSLEGFHLYLLLIQVFNIYVRRYLLKLSLVGWGLPTLIAVVCGSFGVYGKYSLNLSDAKNHNSTAQICWVSSEFTQSLVVSYITTVAFPCVVILCNACMLGLVVFKLWQIRGGGGGAGSSNGYREVKTANRLWKDCVTVLGLSCVLGIPWALASTTYISLPGIYLFTILNSLQGVFMFLWSLALTCKFRSDNNSSTTHPSSLKMSTLNN